MRKRNINEQSLGFSLKILIPFTQGRLCIINRQVVWHHAKRAWNPDLSGMESTVRLYSKSPYNAYITTFNRNTPFPKRKETIMEKQTYERAEIEIIAPEDIIRTSLGENGNDINLPDVEL